MSDREKAYQLLDAVPDYKIGYVVAFLQGLTACEEGKDELYCQKLYQNYLEDTATDKDETYTLDECKKE
ncbi:MAG: hypothetical protein HDR12_11005 [Lachnospiraceae bacterium]|nr:hypothetical protein [Lachnospiraceae bacterium]